MNERLIYALMEWEIPEEFENFHTLEEFENYYTSKGDKYYEMLKEYEPSEVHQIIDLYVEAWRKEGARMFDKVNRKRQNASSFAYSFSYIQRIHVDDDCVDKVKKEIENDKQFRKWLDNKNE